MTTIAQYQEVGLFCPFKFSQLYQLIPELKLLP